MRFFRGSPGGEGFGDLLAQGSLAAARKIGGTAVDAVVHVKGLDLPMHDPRGFHGMGLAYMMSNRGACHLQHAVLATEQGMASWPQLFPMKDDYKGTTSEGRRSLSSTRKTTASSAIRFRSATTSPTA